MIRPVSATAQQAGRVVTDQAVILQLSPANIFSRGGAFIIDGVCYILGFFVSFVALEALIDAETVDAAASRMLMIVGAVTWLVIVPWAVEVLSSGRSLGKLVFGLRVVRDDAGPVRPRHSLARVLVGFLELWTTAGSLAALTSFFNAHGKRLGDMVAGTYVISVRAPKMPDPLPDVPAHLQSWAQIADVGRIPQTLTLDIHRFLGQLPQLTPQARQYHADRLLAALSEFVSPGPPAGVSAEDFLLAAVAERRNRDYRTLQQRRQSRLRIVAELNR